MFLIQLSCTDTLSGGPDGFAAATAAAGEGAAAAAGDATGEAPAPGEAAAAGEADVAGDAAAAGEDAVAGEAAGALAGAAGLAVGAVVGAGALAGPHAASASARMTSSQGPARRVKCMVTSLHPPHQRSTTGMRDLPAAIRREYRDGAVLLGFAGRTKLLPRRLCRLTNGRRVRAAAPAIGDRMGYRQGRRGRTSPLFRVESRVDQAAPLQRARGLAATMVDNAKHPAGRPPLSLVRRPPGERAGERR